MFAINKFELIAYRGGAGERPENTALAFDHAINTFQDVILDVDLQYTRDKKVIVFHDSTLERTTNGTGKTREHSLQELKQLDAGFRFQVNNGSFRYREHRDAKIMELDELLRRFPDNRMLLDIRIHDATFIDQVLSATMDADATARCVIMSESKQTIRYVRKNYPSIQTAASAMEVRMLLMGSKLGIARMVPSQSEYFMIPETHNGMQVVGERFLNELKRRGKNVYIWTVDKSSDASRLQQLGVHGIFTNFPSQLYLHKEPASSS